MHTLVTDNKKRVRLPGAEPGDVFAYETHLGHITLTPVVKVVPKATKAHLVKGPNGYSVFETGRLITQEEVRKALDEFP